MVGNIDIVISKSFIRFSLNTPDGFKYIWQLKDKIIPAYFEKENINTMDTKGEVYHYAFLAQYESQSLS